MRNLIYQLKPRLYPPFHLKKKVERFKIYIDESILYTQSAEKMVAQRFITAFYAIKATDIEKLNYNYRLIIYQNKDSNEKKSNQVSDETNKQALGIAQKYLKNAYILERPTIDYAQYGDWKKNMLLSMELLSYIQPIKKILGELKKQIIGSEFEVDVIIDRTSQNCIDPCLTFNKNLLQKIAREVSDSDKQITVNYQTIDSKESCGIQVADMLAGAYRKELLYRQSETPVTLIPFSYQKTVLDADLKSNSNFLKILGQIVYEQLPHQMLPANKTVNKEIPKSKLNFGLPVLIRSFKLKHLKLIMKKDVFSDTTALLYRLGEITTTSKRKKIIEECCNLNKGLVRIVDMTNIKLLSFTANLSHKTSNKHYQKTLKNLQSNLSQLKGKISNRVIRKIIISELKSFNNEIKKYF